MTEQERFEHQLAEALRNLAAEATPRDDLLGLADGIVRDHRRRGRGPVVGFDWPWGWTRWALVGALLVLLSIIGLAVAGAWLRNRENPIEPAPPGLPLGLQGTFEGNGPGADALGNYGTYRLDLGAPSIVQVLDSMGGPDNAHARNGVWGSVQDWVGRTSDFIPAGRWSYAGGDGELVITAAPACGSARYRVHADQDGPHFTPLRDACAERVAVLTRSKWDRVSVPLAAGHTYGSFSFSEPFHFAAPTSAGADPWVSTGNLFIRGYGWSIAVLDDEPVQADVCDPSKGRLPDLPATPEDVGTWLRASSRLTVSEVTSITVDGRPALRFALQPSDACQTSSPFCRNCPGDLEGTFSVGFRIYAVSAPDDMVVLSVTSDEGGRAEAELFVEAMVGSMTFDDR
jgi:hypothetical protein